MISRLMELNAGEILFKEGDPSRKIYIVKDGFLMVFRQRGDLEIPLEILKTGDLIGTVSLFSSEPRSACVRALSPVVLEIYEEIDPHVFLSTVPAWVLAVFKDVSTRLKRMDQLIVESRQNEKELRQKFSNRYTYGAILCRLLRLMIETRAGGKVLQVKFSIQDFPSKAASVLQVKESIVKEIFDVILQSSYLKTGYNHKEELCLESPRVEDIDRLADFLELKSKSKQAGIWIPNEHHLYKALKAFVGNAKKILKLEKNWINHIEKKLDQKIDPDFIQRAQTAGVITLDRGIDSETYWINLEALEVQLDCEKISLELSKLFIVADSPESSL